MELFFAALQYAAYVKGCWMPAGGTACRLQEVAEAGVEQASVEETAGEEHRGNRWLDVYG